MTHSEEHEAALVEIDVDAGGVVLLLELFPKAVG